VQHFADMARAESGCEIWQQDFLKLDLPDITVSMVYRHTNDAYPLWETFEPLRHFQVDENAERITMTVTCLGRKASSKMIESAALVELSGALAATNR
jgi:hypothetical protein